MPFEDDFTGALQEAGQSFEPDVVVLVNGGVREGRRQRRRRTATVLGGVSALAVAGVVGGLLLPGAASSGPVVGPAHSGTGPAVPTATSAVPTATPTTHTAVGVFSAQQMVAALKSQLPTGSVTQAVGRGTDGSVVGAANAQSGAPFAGLVLDDGHGAAQIEVTVNRVSPTAQASEVGGLACPDPAYAPYTVCTVAHLPGGTRYQLEQGYEFPDKHPDTKDWTGYLTAADGMQVVLQEWNAPAEKGAATTRPNPPLDSTQIQKILSSHIWTAPFTDLPQSQPVTAPTTPQDTAGAQILANLDRLLPAGITASQQNSSDGFADLQVNDGHGPALLQINVQHWNLSSNPKDPTSDAAAMASLFAGATTLPNGDKLRLFQSPGSVAGTVERTADLLQPDGLRIAIMELNSPSQITAATRPDPVLTLDQLKAVATSSLWK